MRFVCSLICVDDVARATRFYRDLLEQRVRYDFGENVAFEGGFALHQAAHFGHLLGVPAPQTREPAHGFELYFECEGDLAALEQRIADVGASDRSARAHARAPSALVASRAPVRAAHHAHRCARRAPALAPCGPLATPLVSNRGIPDRGNPPRARHGR